MEYQNEEEFEESKLSLRKYRVTDLIESQAQLKVLFVLESPHKDEFVHSHPAAGSTGKKLSALFKSQGFLSQFSVSEPIGCQIIKHNYQNLGIIEVSNLPMDADFYPCDLSSSDKKFIQSLDSTKNRLEKGIKKNIPNGRVEQYLLKDFLSRLSINRIDSSVIIISFGHIAANFLNAVNVIPDLQLPHPTGQSWSKAAAILTTYLSKSSRLNQSLLP